MKIKLLVCLLVSLLAVSAFALPRQDDRRAANTISEQVDNNTFVDANRILMFVTNHGNFGRDLSGVFGYDYGTWFPFAGTDLIELGGVESQWSPLYAAGLWVGGIDAATGDTVLAVSEYASEYVPGPMAGGTFSPDVPEYRVYKLYRDSLEANPNQDYLDWPVDQGAPVVRDSLGDIVMDINGLPTPDMIGDQMLWSVFNDANPDQHIGQTDGGETDPIGIEVKQTIFAFNREGSLGNMVFFRLRIYNKGARTLNNTYFSLWADPDVGDAGDDFVGCDTLIDLGFAYNETDFDAQYAPTGVPCLGFDFFQGPLVETGDPNDEAFMWGDTIQGYVNLGMVSFNKYINGTDPDNFEETYRYMNGLDGKTGNPYIYNGDTLLYQKSGDPVAGTGDLDDASADRRFMQSTGPVTFAPGDSTEIIAAIIVGQGNSATNSVQVMKLLDEFAQKLYPEFDPPSPPAAPNVEVGEMQNQIVLTWDDTSEVSPGDYAFEGYSVWQGESRSGPWTLLETYDLDNDRGALVDTVRDNESGLDLPVVRRVGRNSGLAYHYRVTRDALRNEALRDLTEYYFRVTAFSYDSILAADGSYIPNGDRFLESATPVTVVPQSPEAGINPQISGYDTLDVTHTSAGPVLSDGEVLPIVVDNRLLDGHTYRVVFFEDGSGGYEWNLEDVTADSIVFEAKTNQSGDDDYFAYQGFLVKVLGPPVALKGFSYSAINPNDARPFTGVNWGGSGFFGGIGVFDEFFGSDLTPADARVVEIRFVGAGNGQNAYLYDRSNGYAYEGFFPQEFEVWDVTPGTTPRQVNFSFVENDFALPHTQRDSLWNPWINLDSSYVDSVGDTVKVYDGLGGREYFQIMTSDYSATPLANYAVNAWFTGGSGNTMDVMYGGWMHQRGSSSQADDVPDSGDVFTMEPNFINLPEDTFMFVASAPVLTSTEDDLDQIKPVPNPFYLFGEYDAGPGNKVIKFHHMPGKATISIYNLAGERVRTIDHESGPIASWDALTDQGLPVASGIYIYVVDAPGFGQKIGKMAVFTEQEVLQIY